MINFRMMLQHTPLSAAIAEFLDARRAERLSDHTHLDLPGRGDRAGLGEMSA